MKILVSAFFYLLLWITPVFAKVVGVPSQYEDINEAILSASDGDTILVDPGIYSVNVDFMGKLVTLASNFIYDSSQSTIASTFLTAPGKQSHPDTGTVVTFRNGETSQARLTGFTIKGGYGTIINDSFVGGGILCLDNSSPTVSHNIIRGNNALVGGGGAFIDSDPVFIYNQVYNNNALQGGGLYLDNSAAIMDRNIFAYNTATDQGGGIYIYLCDGPVITNSVIYANSSALVGGIDCFFSFPEIDYNDCFGNQGGDWGDCGEGLGDTLTCLNFNNMPSDIYYNFARDPRFSNPTGGDFHLLGDSPLVDAGAEFSETFPWNGYRSDVGLYEIEYLISDSNGDRVFNLSDAVHVIRYIFLSGAAPYPLYSADFNCDRSVNITDAYAMISYIFLGGAGACEGVEWPVPCE